MIGGLQEWPEVAETTAFMFVGTQTSERPTTCLQGQRQVGLTGRPNGEAQTKTVPVTSPSTGKRALSISSGCDSEYLPDKLRYPYVERSNLGGQAANPPTQEPANERANKQRSIEGRTNVRPAATVAAPFYRWWRVVGGRTVPTTSEHSHHMFLSGCFLAINR